MFPIEEPFCPDGRPARVWVVVASLAALGFLVLGFAWALLILASADDDIGGPFGGPGRPGRPDGPRADGRGLFRPVAVLWPGPPLGVADDGRRHAAAADPRAGAVGAGGEFYPGWAAPITVGLVLMIQVLAWLPATRRLFWDRRLLIEG